MAISAQEVVERIQQNLGVPWKAPTSDAFQLGQADAEVTGVVTSFAASLEVMHKAVAAGRNMIVSRETPLWDRNSAPGGRGRGRGPAPEALMKNPTYALKKEYAEKNKLIVYRLSENWGVRKQNGQLFGLAKALGWDKNYTSIGAEPWLKSGGYFDIPAGTLKSTAQAMKSKLRMKSIRMVGDPTTPVSRAALSPGYYLVPDLEKDLTIPGVNLIVIGEPVEWEASPYFADLVASGQKKGLIILGNEVSEEPGSGEMAAWLKTFVSEVPIEWIPAGEPSWMPY